jgi:HTH-type transcriptional regulator/antitoxin HigA
MEPIPFKVIKSLKQYKDYCNALEELVMAKKKTRHHQDAIDLLTLLIGKWDEDHNSFSEVNPVEALEFLMNENGLKGVDLANELGVSKSLISDILHYRRGFSREIIRKLADRFKVSQELFNRPYIRVVPANGPKQDAASSGSRKKAGEAAATGAARRAEPASAR